MLRNQGYVSFALFEAVAEKIKAAACSLSYLETDYFEVGAEWDLSPMGCYLFFIKLLKHKDMELCVDLKRLARLHLDPKATLITCMQYVIDGRPTCS